MQVKREILVVFLAVLIPLGGWALFQSLPNE